MKKLYKLAFSLSLLIMLGSSTIKITNNLALEAEANEELFELMEQQIPLKDRMDLAWEQEFELTNDPNLGFVPRERLLDAWNYMQNLFAQKGLGKAAIPNVNWQERGPKNCGGRSRSLLVDLADATRKTIWVGSVGGGLWKTTDITQPSPNWAPINDLFQNLAITSIAQASNNTSIMYFATGEGNGNSDAIRGLGVWKSVNNGNTWVQLNATNNSNFYYTQKIMCNANGDTVFVCTKTGLYRSVNGGTTFVEVLGTGISTSGGDIAQDIERMANGTLYCTMSGTGTTSGTIHKSYNNGTTWTTPLTLPTYIGKREMEIGVSSVDTNTIYLLCESSSRISGILKSSNAGVSFDTTASHPVDADSGIPGSGNPWKDFSRGQAWYDLSIVVDPNNANICFVGGVDLFKTNNGGSSWNQVSHWYGGFGFQEVHADQQSAVYEPGNSNNVYFTNDGGIYRCTNATASLPTLTSKEINYNTTQFYACDIHPTLGNNFFLAGSQDNGSHRFNTAGINSTAEVTGGDGAFCHIDQDQPQFMWTSYVYTAYYRSTNGGNSFSSALGTTGNIGSFISPTDYDDIGNRMYMCGNNGYFVRWNNPQTGNSLTYDTVSLFNNGKVTHVKVSPNFNNRVYFGLNNGRVIRIDSAHLSVTMDTYLNNGAGMPATSVSCIEVEKGNDNHIIVTYSSYGVNSVWETKNGGVNWTSVEGNIPDMPVRWALFNPLKNWQVMLATELGVWTTDTLTGTTTNWQPTNNGFANVRTDMLKYRTSDNLVIAATHGRGLFSCNAFSPPAADFIADKTLTYIGETINFTSTSSGATSYSWNFGDGTFSTLQNPAKTYANDGLYTVTLTINGGPLNKVITNYIKILPYKPIPYTLAAGGNFDSNPNDFGAYTPNGTAFVRGSSTVTAKSGTASGSFAWVTGLTGNYADNTTTYLYTPSFNFTATGSYTVKFMAKNKFEIGWDGYIVEYSLNHGTTWLQLGNAVATNWYDFANTTQNTAFSINTPYFNATKSSFTQMQYNASFLAGNSKVCFRITFKSDAAVNDAGVAIDDFEITGPNNSALPVKLISFLGNRLNKNEVSLSWQTALELNNAGFWLERNLGNAQFEKITFIKGVGSSHATQNYYYTDLNNFVGDTYYRLAQQDLNGKINLSKIIKVGAHKTDETFAEFWLDYANNNILVNSLEGNLEVSIHSLDGKIISKQSFIEPNFTININNLSKGIYIIKIKNSAGFVVANKILLP